MLPIFKDYIKFLKSKTDNLSFLREGIYWYDKSIIKAYTIDGELIKIARLKIDDKLNVTATLYDDIFDIQLETWLHTIKRNIEHLDFLEKESLKLIKYNLDTYKNNNLGILYSSGKDSIVTKHLVKKCTSEIKLLFFLILFFL